MNTTKEWIDALSDSQCPFPECDRTELGALLSPLARIEAADISETLTKMQRDGSKTEESFESVCADKETLLDIVRALKAERDEELARYQHNARELTEEASRQTEWKVQAQKELISARVQLETARGYPRCLACGKDFDSADEVRVHARECEPHELCQALRREAAEKVRADRLRAGLILAAGSIDAALAKQSESPLSAEQHLCEATKVAKHLGCSHSGEAYPADVAALRREVRQ